MENGKRSAHSGKWGIEGRAAYGHVCMAYDHDAGMLVSFLASHLLPQSIFCSSNGSAWAPSLLIWPLILYLPTLSLGLKQFVCIVLLALALHCHCAAWSASGYTAHSASGHVGPWVKCLWVELMFVLLVRCLSAFLTTLNGRLHKHNVYQLHHQLHKLQLPARQGRRQLGTL